MNSVVYVLFISFLLSQATTIVNARPQNVDLSPSVTTKDNNEKLITHKTGSEEQEKRIPPPGIRPSPGKESEEREKRVPPAGISTPTGKESEEREKRIPPPGIFAPSGPTFE